MRDSLGIPRSLLVLGGTSEIALAAARALAARGTRRVVLAGRDDKRLEDAAAPLRGSGVEVETARLEALDMQHHRQLVDDVFDREGDIDAAMIAFGEYGDQDHLDSDPEAARRLVETNFTAAVSLAIPVAARMRAQGHGLIVALSSAGAARPRASEHVYAASKAGLDAYFQGLGDRLAGSGVQVMIVRPGFVATKLTAGRARPRRATSPETVGEAIARGLERDAEELWVPAWLRWAAAVARNLPRPLFRRLSAAMRRRDGA